jgi:hypothetical protein
MCITAVFDIDRLSCETCTPLTSICRQRAKRSPKNAPKESTQIGVRKSECDEHLAGKFQLQKNIQLTLVIAFFVC